MKHHSEMSLLEKSPQTLSKATSTFSCPQFFYIQPDLYNQKIETANTIILPIVYRYVLWRHFVKQVKCYLNCLPLFLDFPITARGSLFHLGLLHIKGSLILFKNAALPQTFRPSPLVLPTCCSDSKSIISESIIYLIILVILYTSYSVLDDNRCYHTGRIPIVR